MNGALQCHLNDKCVCEYPPRIYLPPETKYLKLVPGNFDLSEITQLQSGQDNCTGFQSCVEDSIVTRSPTLTKEADNDVPGGK